ncbi:hypothetical protein CYMTET_20510 [Cymbomonas tetramitiformis]|uniref:DUF7796 domain-containing protein n=1 Tax=Cymbomonas tetramitiformis TaxID=36881 RepID=A0AAE0G402_9CHLO|nr:hypothetical protein CYMTET_20510 [Cymbomonas tetramitiformis]
MASVSEQTHAPCMRYCPNFAQNSQGQEGTLSRICQEWWDNTAGVWSKNGPSSSRGIIERPLAVKQHVCHKGAAICFSGQIRTLRETIKNLRAQVFHQFASYDVFAVVSSEDEVAPVLKLLQPKIIVIRDQVAHEMSDTVGGVRLSTTPGYYYATRDGTTRMEEGQPHLARWLKQLCGIALCNELRHCYEDCAGVDYRWVVRLRYDVILEKPLRVGLLQESCITIPQVHAHGGFNDKFAIGTPHNMDIYSQQLSKLYSHSVDAMPSLQAETWLKRHLNAHNVSVQEAELPVYIFRADGSLSPT